MDRIIEFQRWIGNCTRDAKKNLDLNEIDICYVLAVEIVKQLLKKLNCKKPQ